MLENSTIRQIINNFQNEILKGNLEPARASTILIEGSALLGNVNDFITKNDIAYNKVLLDYLDEEKTANRARIRANITPQYEEMRNARNTEKVLLEMLRGLKYYLKVKEEEYKSGSNM